MESKKTSENTQTISSATQQQSSAIEEIASSSSTLAQLAESLKDTVGKALKKLI